MRLWVGSDVSDGWRQVPPQPWPHDGDESSADARSVGWGLAPAAVEEAAARRGAASGAGARRGGGPLAAAAELSRQGEAPAPRGEDVSSCDGNAALGAAAEHLAAGGGGLDAVEAVDDVPHDLVAGALVLAGAGAGMGRAGG